MLVWKVTNVRTETAVEITSPPVTSVLMFPKAGCQFPETYPCFLILTTTKIPMHLLINPINIYFQSFKEQVNGWHSSGHKKWNIIILNMLRPPIFISYVLKLLSPALASPCGGKGRSTAEELALPSCLHCCWLPAVWLVRNAASSYQRALEQNYMQQGEKEREEKHEEQRFSQLSVLPIRKLIQLSH